MADALMLMRKVAISGGRPFRFEAVKMNVHVRATKPEPFRKRGGILNILGFREPYRPRTTFFTSAIQSMRFEMARPRLPAAKAGVIGATLKDAGRFKDRKAPKRTRALGQPYKTMSEAEVAAWNEFAAELPWLNSSHRALLQLACRLRARLNTDPDMGVNAMQAYSAILSKLAATPVDETKVSHGDDGDEDPADRFFH